MRREKTERANKYRDSAERLRECRETEGVQKGRRDVRDRESEESQSE